MLYLSICHSQIFEIHKKFHESAKISNYEWKLKRYLNLSTQPMNTILDITFRLHRSKL